jgi:hypothetical protein
MFATRTRKWTTAREVSKTQNLLMGEEKESNDTMNYRTHQRQQTAATLLYIVRRTRFANQNNTRLRRTLIILGEIPPHDLIDSRPFRGRGMACHSTLGVLGGDDGGGGMTPGGGEEGGAS